MTNRFILTSAAVLACCILAYGNETINGTDDLSSRIQQADSLYGRSEFPRAAQLFHELIANNSAAGEVTRLRVMEAKSWYYAGDSDRAAELFRSLAVSRESLPYESVCHYFLGRIAFEDGDYLESGERFSMAYDLTTDPEMRRISYSNCLNLCIGYLSPSEQRSFLKTSYRIAPELFSKLAINTASKYHEMGLHKGAARVIDIYSAYITQDDDQSARLKREINLALSSSLEIALLVPLSGELAAYGRQMSAAAELAVSTYDKTDADIHIRSYDTFGSSIAATQVSRKVTSSGASAVIGPLTSQEAVGAAPYSDFWSVPMILPAASEKGLTYISDHVFQLSPTPETMGERLAEAAVSELGLDSVAILAPNDNYGRQITEGFKKVAGDNGVDVFYEVYFPRGGSDYRRFMMNLKEAVLPDTFDSTIFIDELGDTLETEEVTVDIPTLLIPAYAQDLRYIIPQLRFYRINSIILGGEDLGDPEVLALDEMRHYPAMFVSHATFTEADTNWFRLKYVLEEGNDISVTPVAGLTFDAVRLTIQAAELGGFSSDGILHGWEKLGRIDGVTGPFEFNDQNENVAVPVFMLLDGRIEKWPY